MWASQGITNVHTRPKFTNFVYDSRSRNAALLQWRGIVLRVALLGNAHYLKESKCRVFETMLWVNDVVWKRNTKGSHRRRRRCRFANKISVILVCSKIT